MSRFAITDGKGFQITLKNGHTVSIQIGYGNYVNREPVSAQLNGFRQQIDDIKQGRYPETNLAETAILNEKGFVRYKGDDVQGYQTPEDVLRTIIYAASLRKIRKKVVGKKNRKDK